MIPAWWRRRLRNGTESAELSLPPRDQLCHEIRNALAGIALEQKLAARAIVRMTEHMRRIEEALK
jgi:hypothetical protein